MSFNIIKKLLKNNHVKFLLAIFVSILIHLFLLGGIDIYNPFFLKNSDNLNIVIESHLESPIKDEDVIKKKKTLTSKKNKQIDNSLNGIKESSIKDLDQTSLGSEKNQITDNEKRKTSIKK